MNEHASVYTFINIFTPAYACDMHYYACDMQYYILNIFSVLAHTMIHTSNDEGFTIYVTVSLKCTGKK